MQFLKITNKNRKKINKLLLLCNFQNPYNIYISKLLYSYNDVDKEKNV